MRKDYKSGDVYSMFCSALGLFIDCVRIDLRNGNFANMSRPEQLDAGRALAALADVKKYPRKYLSREWTEYAWRARANAYAIEHNVDMRNAYYIVSSPVADVMNTVSGIRLNPELRQYLYRLCDNFMRWEYGFSSESPEAVYGANIFANNLERDYERLAKWASQHKSVCQYASEFVRKNKSIRAVRNAVRVR